MKSYNNVNSGFASFNHFFSLVLKVVSCPLAGATSSSHVGLRQTGHYSDSLLLLVVQSGIARQNGQDRLGLTG